MEQRRFPTFEKRFDIVKRLAQEILECGAIQCITGSFPGKSGEPRSTIVVAVIPFP